MIVMHEAIIYVGETNRLGRSLAQKNCVTYDYNYKAVC